MAHLLGALLHDHPLRANFRQDPRMVTIYRFSVVFM
ncbi:hypothetical protein LINPERPRIM_LOCUS44168 [Linum perenne]